MSNIIRIPGAFSRLCRRMYLEEALAALAFAMFLLTLSAQALMAHEFKAGAIEIEHPWTRATPDGASVGAGYLVLKNDGATPDRLVSATAEAAQKVEIHEMAMTDGVMTTRPVPGGLVVPAHGSVALKPGSYHLMLMGLKQPLKQGALVNGTLTFEKAGTVSVQFKVESIAAQGSSDGGGHDHMTMPSGK
ncbi:copper chaperone PCu(A)C [Roseixanthobacter pseudopolyaromaticivorans]|uniref:copper chaperone PCu(A)C n=1 Tax=Xanthobacteraceae TaxID=335928 RepID=UPI00372A5C19